MLQILDERNSFETIENEYLELQKGTFRILNKLRLKKYHLGNVNKWDIDTANTVISLPYGSLIKAHQVNYPLRPVISIIGSPTRKLKELLSNIIEKSITVLKFLVNNRPAFLELIVIMIPQNHILASFDIAIFPKTPLDKVKDAIEKILDSIKDHTEIPYKQYNKAISFVFHFIHFQFDGKFYHKKIRKNKICSLTSFS